MQTFMPTGDFRYNAFVLDDRRLGKQIIEARQIGRAITDPTYGWQSHPAVTMWRGHLPALLEYASAMAGEWFMRTGRIHAAYTNMLADHDSLDEPPVSYSKPMWCDDPRVHASHQSNLVRKSAEEYAPHFPDVPDDLDYYWPNLP